MLQGGADEAAEGGFVLADFHAAASQDVAGADEHGVADALGFGEGFVEVSGGAGGGALEFEGVQDLVEALAVFGAVDGVDGGADDGCAGLLEAVCEVQGRLAAELDDDAVDGGGLRVEAFDHVERVFQRQRFKEQQVAGVVVGADRLGVGVDHHAFEAKFLGGEGGVDAAVVKLDALADTVGATADDDDFFLVGDADFVLSRRDGIRDSGFGIRADGAAACFVRRVVVRRDGGELGGAGVDELVDGVDAQALAVGADFEDGVGGDGAFVEVGKLGVAVAELLGFHENVGGDVGEGLVVGEGVFKLNELLDLVEEPGVDVGEGVDLLDAPAHLHRVADVVEPALAGHGELAREFFVGNGPLNGLAVGGAEAGVGLGSDGVTQ